MTNGRGNSIWGRGIRVKEKKMDFKAGTGYSTPLLTCGAWIGRRENLDSWLRKEDGGLRTHPTGMAGGEMKYGDVL